MQFLKKKLCQAFSMKIFQSMENIPKKFMKIQTIMLHLWVKARKKEPNNVWTILKNCFLKIEKSPWEHYV